MPIDRFHEIAIKAHRGDIITVTFYYSMQSSTKGVKYPIRLDFEVQKWPQQANLRGFAYSFVEAWLDQILLPLQSSDVKWHKMTVRVSGQYYQVPLVGKYGLNEGPPASDRPFCVSLIPNVCAKGTKTFRVRGVADIYELFDRPDNKTPEIVERPRLLERALVSPFSLSMGNGLEEAVLRYVRLPEAKGKTAVQEPGKKKEKRVPILFTAAFCLGFL